MSRMLGLYLSLRDLEEMMTERGMCVAPFHDRPLGSFSALLLKCFPSESA